MPRALWIVGLLVLLLGGAIWWWKSTSGPATDSPDAEPGISYWGRVVDSLERPVVGAQVVALGDSASDEIRAVTSRQGRFHLELPPSDLPRARIFKKGYQVAVVELFPAERVEEAVDYPLFTGGSFRGRVLDPAGQPLPRLKVTLLGERGSRDESHTNPRGEFELWGALGDAIVTVHSSRFADHREFVTLSRESSGDIVPLTLEPGGAVDLFLSDVRQPIAGVEATVLTPNGDHETRRSNPEGKVVLDGLGFGRATLILTRPGWTARVESLSIEPGPPITRSIRMTPAPEWNLLIENDAGRSVTPRRVQLFLGNHALLDTDGKPGSLDVLDPSKTYRLVVEAEGYATRTSQIRLDAAPDRVLTLRLERGSEVRGEVRDGRGNPLPGARLTIIDGRERAFTPDAMSFELRTTNDGRFRSPVLAVGRYRTRVSPQDGPEWEVSFEVPRDAGDTVTLDPWRP